MPKSRTKTTNAGTTMPAPNTAESEKLATLAENLATLVARQLLRDADRTTAAHRSEARHDQ